LCLVAAYRWGPPELEYELLRRSKRSEVRPGQLRQAKTLQNPVQGCERGAARGRDFDPDRLPALREVNKQALPAAQRAVALLARPARQIEVGRHRPAVPERY